MNWVFAVLVLTYDYFSKNSLSLSLSLSLPLSLSLSFPPSLAIHCNPISYQELEETH